MKNVSTSQLQAKVQCHEKLKNKNLKLLETKTKLTVIMSISSLIIVNSFNSIQTITSSILNQLNYTDVILLPNGPIALPNLHSTVPYGTVEWSLERAIFYLH